MLDDTQKATLRAHILGNADPYVLEQREAGSDGGVAEWYNREADPQFWVWRTLSLIHI